MKQYVKPELYYENFELSEHIATCAWDMANSTDVKTCSATGDEAFGYLPGLIRFIDGNNLCTTIMEGEDYCYTTGGAGNNIFNS